MTSPRVAPFAEHQVPDALRSGERQARMGSILAKYRGFVSRTLRWAGVPPSELDDEVQRTFVIAFGRLEDMQPEAERRFLFNVALNVAAHLRRTLARRREVLCREPPERVDTPATPEHLIQRKRVRELLDDILSRMSESLRTVFMLYAFEEMRVTDIAAALGVPRGTVESRLRRAQRHFRDFAETINWHREGRA